MIRHKDFLFITVDRKAIRFKVDNGLCYLFTFFTRTGGNDESIRLPPGSWQLIGFASELTEEQWREIVEWYGAGDGSVDEAGVGDTFMCYDESDFCFDTGITSGMSLLRSHNLNANQTVILKLIQP